MGQRHVAPFAVRPITAHRAAEGIRVGHLERAFGSVNLDRHVRMALHVKACIETDDRPASKLQERAEMRLDFNGKTLAPPGAAADRALRKRFAPARHDSADRAK